MAELNDRENVQTRSKNSSTTLTSARLPRSRNEPLLRRAIITIPLVMLMTHDPACIPLRRLHYTC